MNSLLLLTNLAIGPLLLVLALIFRAYPPKNINWVYGYRTERSRKSQQAWDAANKYSNELMMWVGIITTIAQIGLYFIFEPSVVLLVACGIMVALLIAMIIIVETYLKNNFDNEGNKNKQS